MLSKNQILIPDDSIKIMTEASEVAFENVSPHKNPILQEL